MSKRLKRVVLLLSLILLVVSSSVIAYASSWGDGGGTSGGTGSGADDVNDIPPDRALAGVRIYLVPGSCVDMTGKKLIASSDYEKYAKYATYILGATNTSGTFEYLTDSDKFTFHKNLITLGDFYTSAYNTDRPTTPLTNYNIYDVESKENSLLDAIVASKTTSLKISKNTDGSSRRPESCMIEWSASSTSVVKKFYTEVATSVAQRNWTVGDLNSAGKDTFFTSTLSLDSDSNFTKALAKTSAGTYTNAILEFRDYTAEVYSGFSTTFKNVESLVLLVEPVFGYYNNTQLNAAAVLSAQQHARWVLGVKTNYYYESDFSYSTGTTIDPDSTSKKGIMYWYEKHSDVNNSSADYVLGRSSNRSKTKLFTLTSYNMASTLRPYGSVTDTSKLSQLGGIGVVFQEVTPIQTFEGNLAINGSVKINTTVGADGGVPDTLISFDFDTDFKTDSDKIGTRNAYAKEAKSTASKTEGEYTELNDIAVTPTSLYTFIMKIGKEDPDVVGKWIKANLKTMYSLAGDGATDTKISTTLNNSIEARLGIRFPKASILSAEQDTGSAAMQFLPYIDNTGVHNLEYLAESVRQAFALSSSNGGLGFMNTLESNKYWVMGNLTNQRAFIRDETSKTNVTNISTLYSGLTQIDKSTTNMETEGYIPVTVALNTLSVESEAKVNSYYNYFTYIKNGATDESSIKDSGSGSAKLAIVGENSSKEIPVVPTNTTTTNKAFAKYFVITFDNYSNSRKANFSSSVSTATGLATFKSNLKDILDSYPLMTNTNSNNTASFNSIKTALTSTTVSGKYAVNGTTFGIKACDSYEKAVLETRNISGRLTGTQAVIIEYVFFNQEDNTTPDYSGSFEQHKLNNIENFYGKIDGIVDNRGFEVSDPTYTYSGVLSDRAGSPIYNRAPINGSFLVNNVLDSVSRTRLGVKFIWTANQKISATTTDGTKSLSVPQVLYANTRQLLGNNKNIAEFSVWNNTTNSVNTTVYGSTIKNTLNVLGYKFSNKPEVDKTSQTGGGGTASTITLNNTQTINTMDSTGWIVKDTYADGTVKTQTVSGKFKFAKLSIVNSNLVVSNISESRTYAINYKVYTYTAKKDSTPTGSGNTFTPSAVNKDGFLLVSDRSNKVLGVYPEVAMRLTIPKSTNVNFSTGTVSDTYWTLLGDEYTPVILNNQITPKGNNVSSILAGLSYYDVYTVGEKARYFNPTAFHVVSNNFGKDTEAEGELLSNAISTSSLCEQLNSKLGVSNLPVILSGGDFTVKSKVVTKPKVYVSSYVVDIAENDGINSCDTGSAMNVKSLWSALANNSTYSALDIHKGMLESLKDVNLGSFNMDLVVNKDGTLVREELKSNKVNTATKTETTINGVYNITIKGGVVTNKTELINKIAQNVKDTNTGITDTVAQNQAKEIYNGLDIEKSIVGQFETRTSSENASGIVDGSKWYDEACSTLVIRVYNTVLEDTRDNIETVASDKLNISAGTSTSMGTNGIQLYSNGYLAWVELGIGGIGKITLPSGQEVDFGAEKKYVKIKNTDFIIPDASIYDSKY